MAHRHHYQVDNEGFNDSFDGMSTTISSTDSPSPTTSPTAQLFSAFSSPIITAVIAQVNGTNGTSSDDAIDPSTTSNLPVQITNVFSLVACLAVVISYFIFRRKNNRLMERPSLVIAVSMAAADGLLHCINLFGYTDLPHNFICSFFGGFLYAFPTLTSIFYSICIAFNTQLVFLFSKRPGISTLKFYVGVPIALSLCICVPALGAGLYGYDANYDYCWYASNATRDTSVVVKYVFTFALWCLVSMVYLVVAAVTIIHAVFSKSSRLNQLAESLSKTLRSSNRDRSKSSNKYFSRPISTQGPSQFGMQELSKGSVGQPSAVYHSAVYQSNVGTTSLKSQFEDEPPTAVESRIKRITHRMSTSFHQTNSGNDNQHRNNTTLSRRSQAMRALAFRLLGYIMIPTICILPGVIQDLITKAAPQVAERIPDQVSTLFDSLNGLVGLFNAILYAIDPVLLALYYQMKMERKERKMADRGHPPVRPPPEAGETLYITPPESPTLGATAGPEMDSQGHDLPMSLDGGTSHGHKGHPDLETGAQVEVRTGRFLAPLRMGKSLKKLEKSGLPSPRSLHSGSVRTRPSQSIIIRVDVEVDNDRDDYDLNRLERYLGGL